MFLFLFFKGRSMPTAGLEITTPEIRCRMLYQLSHPVSQSVAILPSSLLIHQHWMSFHLIVVFHFFQQCLLVVFSVQVFHLLGRFIPKLLILSDTTMNGIVFLISFSDGLSSVYRIQLIFVYDLLSCNPADLINYHSFLVDFLGL